MSAMLIFQTGVYALILLSLIAGIVLCVRKRDAHKSGGMFITGLILLAVPQGVYLMSLLKLNLLGDAFADPSRGLLWLVTSLINLLGFTALIAGLYEIVRSPRT